MEERTKAILAAFSGALAALAEDYGMILLLGCAFILLDLADVSYSNNDTGGTTIDVLDVLFNKNTTSGIGMRKTIKDTEGVFQYRAESGEFCSHGNQWYDGDAIDSIPTATNIIEE